jgi:hypothetical protein
MLVRDTKYALDTARVFHCDLDMRFFLKASARIGLVA